MDAGLQWPEPRLVDSLPVSTDDRALESALSHLNAAIRWRPRHARAYRLQGQIYSARHDWTKASESFEKARDLTPYHPLPAWESALMYEQMWRMSAIGTPTSTSDSPQSDAATLVPKIRQAWEAAGFDPARFGHLGEQAWQQGRIEQALAWYERARMADGELPPSASFRSTLGSVVTRGILPNTLDAQALKIRPLYDTLRIEAETLVWDWGEPLAARPALDPTIGALWWGEAAVAVIQAPDSGVYSVTMRAQHAPPAPIKLQIEHNFEPIGQFELDRADMSWQEWTTTIALKPGLQIIGVRCLNSGVDGGIKRDAFVDWIRLERVS